MLALKSCIQKSGFSVMDADELYFINGGCGAGQNGGNATKYTFENGNYLIVTGNPDETQAFDSNGNPLKGEYGIPQEMLDEATKESVNYDPETKTYTSVDSDETTQSSGNNSISMGPGSGGSGTKNA